MIIKQAQDVALSTYVNVTAALLPGAPTPTPPPGGGAATSGTGANVQASAPTWINATAIMGLLFFLAAIAFVALGLRQAFGAGKGNIKKATDQSVVAGMGVFWMGFGLVVGTGLMLAIVKLFINP